MAGLKASLISRPLQLPQPWQVPVEPLLQELTACPDRASLRWPWQALATREDFWDLPQEEVQRWGPAALTGSGQGGQHSGHGLCLPSPAGPRWACRSEGVFGVAAHAASYCLPADELKLGHTSCELGWVNFN